MRPGTALLATLVGLVVVCPAGQAAPITARVSLAPGDTEFDRGAFLGGDLIRPAGTSLCGTGHRRSSPVRRVQLPWQHACQRRLESRERRLPTRPVPWTVGPAGRCADVRDLPAGRPIAQRAGDTLRPKIPQSSRRSLLPLSAMTDSRRECPVPQQGALAVLAGARRRSGMMGARSRCALRSAGRDRPRCDPA
jgi:hypothetical protein